MKPFARIARRLGIALVGAALILPALQASHLAGPGVVAAASATQTRFVNFSSYPIISLVVDNVQRLSNGQAIPTNGSGTVALNAGTHTYRAINGFGSTQMYTYQGTFTQQAGVTGQVSFSNPTLAQLLTHFAPTGRWQGTYFDNNGAPHLAAFRFTSAGGWTLFNDGANAGSGTYSLVSANFAAFQVTFRISASYTGTLSLTGGYFMMRNGPASFPLIQYVYQGA